MEPATPSDAEPSGKREPLIGGLAALAAGVGSLLTGIAALIAILR